MAGTAMDSTIAKFVMSTDLPSSMNRFIVVCHEFYYRMVREPSGLNEATTNYMLNIAREYAAILQGRPEPENDDCARLLLQTFAVLHRLKDLCQAASKPKESLTLSPEQISGHEESDDTSRSECASVDSASASDYAPTPPPAADVSSTAEGGDNGNNLYSAHETDDGESSEERQFGWRIINLVRETPFLYDKDHTFYQQRFVKEFRWEQIGAQLGLSGPKARKKWTSMRDVYKKRLNVILSAKAQNKAVTTSRWRYFDALHMMLHMNYDKARILTNSSKKAVEELDIPEFGRVGPDLPEANPPKIDSRRGHVPQDRSQQRLPLDLSISRKKVVKPGECEGEIITSDLEEKTPQFEPRPADLKDDTGSSDNLGKDHSHAPIVHPGSLEQYTAQKRSHPGEPSSSMKKQRTSPAEVVYLDGDLKAATSKPLENGLADYAEIFIEQYLKQQMKSRKRRVQQERKSAKKCHQEDASHTGKALTYPN